MNHKSDKHMKMLRKNTKSTAKLQLALSHEKYL